MELAVVLQNDIDANWDIQYPALGYEKKLNKTLIFFVLCIMRLSNHLLRMKMFFRVENPCKGHKN